MDCRLWRCGRLARIVPEALVVLICAACSVGPGANNPQTPMPYELLPGRYHGVTDRGEMFHTIIPIDFPQYGDQVLYHHISTERFDGPAAQRKVYVFGDGGLVMRSIIPLTTGMEFTDAASAASDVGNLQEQQRLEFPPGCEFVWSREDAQWIGRVARESCRYSSPAFAGEVNPAMIYTLGRCTLTIEEAIYRDGKPVFPPLDVENVRAANEAADC